MFAQGKSQQILKNVLILWYSIGYYPIITKIQFVGYIIEYNIQTNVFTTTELIIVAQENVYILHHFSKTRQKIVKFQVQ
jgi:hypothetical protein